MMIKTYATDKRNEIQNEFITREEGKYEELNHVSKHYQTCIDVYAVILVWLADRSYFSFFKIIMFNSNVLLHIGTCLHSSLRLAFVGLAVFKRKMI